MDSYNYPLMSQSEWENAPWNEEDVMVTAQCTAKVWFGVERKVELETEVNTGIGWEPYVDDSEWEGVYTEECLNPVELIRELAEMVKKHINPKFVSEDEAKHINYLLGEAEGWSCDEWNFDVER